MKRALGYGLLGLASYLLFLVLQFPATTFAGLASRELPALSVGEAQGTAVRGHARGVAIAGVPIERLSWRLQPLGLLRGELRLQVEAQEPGLRLAGGVALDLRRRVRLEGVQGAADLQRSAALLGLSLPYFHGRVAIDLATLELRPDGGLAGASGTLRLEGLRAELGPVMELGTFVVALEDAEPGVRGAVADQGGPLEVEGTLELAAGGEYRLTVFLAPRDSAGAELRELLQGLGRPGSDGRWRLALGGRLAG